jgi:protein-S-isoprenylcysteine O-methyltransferase Ste14
MQPFVSAHEGAKAILAVSVVAAAAAEWAVTARERRRTTLAPEAGRTARMGVALGTLVETTTNRTGKAPDSDRGTKWVLVGSIFVAILLASLAAHVGATRLPGSGWIYVGVGTALIWVGAGLRVWGIAVLGRFFRRVVLIQEGHRVVRDGPYRIIRHPAYAGTLLIAAGIGVFLGNWLSVTILVVIPLLGHLPRIKVEERELELGLGETYRQYEAGTKRLVPGVW